MLVLARTNADLQTYGSRYRSADEVGTIRTVLFLQVGTGGDKNEVFIKMFSGSKDFDQYFSECNSVFTLVEVRYVF